MKKLRNKVSVIVATHNSVGGIEETIKSFIDQKYKNKELIIIDGGSKDGTLNIIKKYKSHISYFVSELDDGISDAFNKGVKVASGNFMFFLGAGDYFWTKDVLERIMTGVNSKINLLVCGRIKRVEENSNTVLYTSSIKFKKWKLLYKMALPHQALFINRVFFDKYGFYDTNCKFAMDYDLLLRAYQNFPDVLMKNVTVAAWRAGGVGKDRTLEIFEEYKRIRIKNKIAPKILIYVIDLVSKLKYFMDKILK